MKRLLFLLFPFVVFNSCSDFESSNAFAMFDSLERADSLYSIGEKDQALILLDTVLNWSYTYKAPSTLKQLGWFITSDIIYEKEKIYYEYLFSYLAQLDAMSMRNKMTLNDSTAVADLKQLFILAPELDEVIEKSMVVDAEIKQLKKWSDSSYSKYYDRYEQYISSCNQYDLQLSNKTDFPKTIYRRKWTLMNKLVLASDALYGYEATYMFFDSILMQHGASLEPESKVIMKAYMGLSGNPDYAYPCDMTHGELMNYLESNENWFVNKISTSAMSFFNPENMESIECYGADILQDKDYVIYNPSLEYCLLYSPLSKHTLLFFDDQGVDSITLYPQHRYNIGSSTHNIDKATLYILLSKYGRKELIPALMQTKQYYLKDTLVREGIERGYYKIYKYDLSRKFLEWRLFTLDKKTICDSTNTHCCKKVHKGDTTITYYYDDKFQLRKTDDAYRIEYGDISEYYNWEHQVIGKKVDYSDYQTIFKETDSMKIYETIYFHPYQHKTTKEFKKYINENPPIHVAILYENYVTIYQNEKDQGSMIETIRLNSKGTLCEDKNGVAWNRAFLDTLGNIVRSEFYDKNINLIMVK